MFTGIFIGLSINNLSPIAGGKGIKMKTKRTYRKPYTEEEIKRKHRELSYKAENERNMKTIKTIEVILDPKSKCACGVNSEGEQVVCFKHGGLNLLKTKYYADMKKAEGKKE